MIRIYFCDSSCNKSCLLSFWAATAFLQLCSRLSFTKIDSGGGLSYRCDGSLVTVEFIGVRTSTGQSTRYRGRHICLTVSHRDLVPSCLCDSFASVKFHPSNCHQIRTCSAQTNRRTDVNTHNKVTNQALTLSRTYLTYWPPYICDFRCHS